MVLTGPKHVAITDIRSLLCFALIHTYTHMPICYNTTQWTALQNNVSNACRSDAVLSFRILMTSLQQPKYPSDYFVSQLKGETQIRGRSMREKGKR